MSALVEAAEAHAHETPGKFQENQEAAADDNEEDDEDAALRTWRAAREAELRGEAEARWSQTRRADAAARRSTEGGARCCTATAAAHA